MKIILVDERDREIGSGEYYKATFTGIYRVSALWVSNDKGQVLLAQRSVNKLTDPGRWGTAAAGTIEVGETYEENIYKEASEEIGLKGFEFKRGPKILNDSNTDRKFFVQWFLCKCDWPQEKFTLQKDEVEQVKWVDKTELAKEIFLHPEKYTVGCQKSWTRFL